MPFNSLEYFLFLWAAVLIFYAAPDPYKKTVLLGLCYLFYASWSLYFALYLLASTAAAYFLAIEIRGASGSAAFQRLCFTAAILLFLGSFIFFKGLPLWRKQDSFLIHLVAPIGFSYYTFRLLSYVIDVYWEKIEPEKGFVKFAAYAAFFPHILSGPILRADEFFPQFADGNNRRPELWVSGFRLILCGLFKKLVVADHLSVVVDNVFGHPAMYNRAAFWIASYSFYLQLYADFSGLADIAIGSGRLFGVDSPPNFNAPYLARNIQDFWRRWHMTLCRWINDYLFLPLRMNLRRWQNTGLVLSIFISMLAISLWHGMSSGFIAFGLIQGVYMSVSAFTLRARDAFFKEKNILNSLRRIAAPIITFHLLVFSFIFFRSGTFSAGAAFFGRLLRGPLQFSVLGMGLGKWQIAGCMGGLILAEIFERSESASGRWQFSRFPAAFRWAFYYLLIAGLLIFGRFWPKEFIYFKF